MDDIDRALRQMAIDEAAQPANQLIAEHALRFIEPIIISNRTDHTDLRSGTATFVDLGDGPLVVTSGHVVRHYWTIQDAGGDAFCQIGNRTINIDEMLIDHDDRYDTATLRMLPQPLHEIASHPRRVPLEVFTAPNWPPTDLVVGDSVSLAGLPGVWRELDGARNMEFGTLVISNADVTSCHADNISCHFDRHNWIQAFGDEGHDLVNFGGMSGGPLFCLRQLHWDFVGVIYEFSADMDVLMAVPAARIEPSGRIIR